MRRASSLLLIVLLAGCPDSKKAGQGDAASLNSGVPLSGKILKKPHVTKPQEAAKSADPFPRDELIELYKGDQLGDTTAARKYGLVDASGKEDPKKRDEYEAALKRFADEHGDELSKIQDELDAARVTSGQPSDVQKK